MITENEQPEWTHEPLMILIRPIQPRQAILFESNVLGFMIL